MKSNTQNGQSDDFTGIILLCIVVSAILVGIIVWMSQETKPLGTVQARILGKGEIQRFNTKSGAIGLAGGTVLGARPATSTSKGSSGLATGVAVGAVAGVLTARGCTFPMMVENKPVIVQAPEVACRGAFKEGQVVLLLKVRYTSSGRIGYRWPN